ncbi:FAD-binding oxidoreductase [Cyanobium sp. HWJ4-Hawea]|uniref:NAD(P)/FAD-dependent oxidoreductase n=1 Tax=Cyanobium sp. HWJ4-Hawea TaxID=2823713 RepID=UPI0020CD2FED|nr:FAD-dependent oxidoreductase [Cyanobium sp. HWJ4-Hawea]MCP9808141.1 FAD-binding oxidoreductase [Cyanobium sp. HWJ4-Hawea]
MAPQDPNFHSQSVLVVGAGMVGLSIAWWLQLQGHRVELIDPQPAASPAALGVLMAQVFHRSSGRGWRLRQRSLELWNQWLPLLADQGHPIHWRPGLLLLAASPEERSRQERLAAERQGQGLPLTLWNQDQLAQLQPQLPPGGSGAIHSAADGQLDPAQALRAFRLDGERLGMATHQDRVVILRRGGAGQRWRAEGQSGRSWQADWCVVSAAVASSALLEPLGYQLPMEPVLGQALELELQEEPGWNWPGAVLWQGINLVPRPDLGGGRRLWLGATLEPGELAAPEALSQLRQLNGNAPPWLEKAQVVRQWQGHRPHPIGQPAPLLQKLEDGLILASGHYRNGVLLAPATAEWVAGQITCSR